MTAGEAAIVGLRGQGILRASSGTTVTGKGGTLYFPIPGPTAEQAPLTFSLTASDPTALKGFEIKPRGADNWVCEAKIEPANSKPVHVRWESLILVRDLPKAKLPPAPLAPVSEDRKTWLASTPVVQSADPAIVAKAKVLRMQSKDIGDFAIRVAQFTSQNQGAGKPFVALDASSALGCGGSCTSRANLAAALLRAGGVPARTVSHLPTFAYGSPLYEHWLTEYWHPTVGWVRLEATLGQLQPPASELATLAYATIEDERQTGKPGQRGWIMPGAAWMSGIQATGNLQPAGTDEDASSNWCRDERRLKVSPELFTRAQSIYPKITDQSWVQSITEILNQRTGPIETAVFTRLDGPLTTNH